MLFLFKRIQTVFLFFIFLLFTYCWHQWDWNPERVLRAVFYQGFWGCGIKMIIIFKYISTYVTRIHALAHNLHQLLQRKHRSVALWSALHNQDRTMEQAASAQQCHTRIFTCVFHLGKSHLLPPALLPSCPVDISLLAPPAPAPAENCRPNLSEQPGKKTSAI